MIAVIGENVIDIFTEADGRFIAKTGGSPLNLAIACALQQVPVSYLSPLSSDAFGDAFLQLLQQRGVTAGWPQRSAAPSSLAFVRIDANGQPSYSLYRQGIADRDYTAEQLIAALPADCRILHTGSLALEPQDAGKLMPVLQAAKQRGIRLSVDINVRLQFVTDVAAYRTHIEQVLQLADYIKASDEDLAALYPALDLQSAVDKVRALAPTALLALTCGAEGATLYLGTQAIAQAVIQPEIFIDTVGAGDTFFANLLVQLLQLHPAGEALSTLDLTHCRSALQRACLAASLNIAKAGCEPPDKVSLDQALAQL
ncbi:PfkB family carbohydrate kinase [Rheinheimera sp.]|uniref:PfkB family carbohydrate kinase n=1 Tax=Rheinheimera sp. TaxID=1869214 RepID=UPI003D2BC428